MSGQWKLNRGLVHNTNNVSNSWSLDDGEERSLQTILCVDLHDLLVIAWTLQQLNSGVQWTSVCSQQDLYRFDRWGKWISVESSSLDELWDAHTSKLLWGRSKTGGTIAIISLDTGIQWKLKVTSVVDRNSILSWAWSFDDSSEWAHASLFDVNSDLLWGIVWTLPQLKHGFQWPSIGSHGNLDSFHWWVSERPCLKSSSLNLNWSGFVPNVQSAG
mmetsp:Transcript_35496/g.50344  ORF Transcript_35496/g.50344 Transcript_35496/m.50344 type:complete len:216 (-) Transcript_35496:193-840(-)